LTEKPKHRKPAEEAGSDWRRLAAKAAAGLVFGALLGAIGWGLSSALQLESDVAYAMGAISGVAGFAIGWRWYSEVFDGLIGSV